MRACNADRHARPCILAFGPGTIEAGRGVLAALTRATCILAFGPGTIEA